MSQWPDRIRWNIVAGCQDESIAASRAKALVAAESTDTGGNSGYFRKASTTILRCLLHAAAVEGLSMREVMKWSQDFADDTPLDILSNHPDATRLWGMNLRRYTRDVDGETAGNIGTSLSNVLESFSISVILDSVCPEPGQGFDVDRFHSSTDTLYLLSQSGKTSLAAPIITALVESINQAALRAATHSRSGRLTPVLTNVLDEVANICPIPSLPTLMTDGRGHGIKTLAVAQDRPALEQRFGRDDARIILNTASMLILLGGSRDDAHLREISSLAGEREISRVSETTSTGHGSTSTSTTTEAVVSVAALREMGEGIGMVFYRDLKPAKVFLPAWWETKQKAEYEAPQEWVLEQEGFAPAPKARRGDDRTGS